MNRQTACDKLCILLWPASQEPHRFVRAHSVQHSSVVSGFCLGSGSFTQYRSFIGVCVCPILGPQFSPCLLIKLDTIVNISLKTKSSTTDIFSRTI